jgi:hypothetical protein
MTMRIRTPNRVDLAMAWVNPNLRGMITLDTKMTVDFSKVDDPTRNRVIKHLRRGYCASLSGKAADMYYLVCGTFHLPVNVISGHWRMVLSVPNTPDGKTDLNAVHDMQQRCETIWKLAYPTLPKGQLPWRVQNASSYSAKGPSTQWTMVTVRKPRELDANGVLAHMGLGSFFDLCPKDRYLEAISALERKSVYNVTFG